MKKISKGKIFISIISVSFLAGLAVLFSSFVAKAAPDSKLYMVPASLTVENNETFSLDARINPGTNEVSTVTLDITFDKTKLRLDSVSKGTVFTEVLKPYDQTPDFIIDNEKGTALIMVAVPLSADYVRVDEKVVTLNFSAIGEVDASQVVLTPDSVAVAKDHDDYVVIDRKGSAVTVKAGSITEEKYDISDFIVLVSDWLKKQVDSPADVNGDKIVNSRDLGIMMSNWNAVSSQLR